VSGSLLYRPPDSVFLPAGESSLRNPVTFAPSQQVLLPLAGDLKLDGRMYEHVLPLSLPRTF
jgi:hypothetical protein